MDRDTIDEVIVLVVASALGLPLIIHLSLLALGGAVR